VNHDPRQLVNGYLDGVLTEEQEGALNAWVKTAPGNAAAFADMVRLHDRLHDVIPTRTATHEGGMRMPAPPQINHRYRSWLRGTIVSGMVAIAPVVIVAIWTSHPPQVSAATELDRLIDRATEAGDRVYRITSLDPNPLPIEPRQAPIDGAKLYVGPPDRYVLIRRFPDGREYATGFDGERNWSAPPDGAVRLSRDPLRFRWPIPGHQYGIPFADLRFELIQLRDAYLISSLGTNVVGQRGLLATKKSPEYRGPNRVELWYDATTGVIHRMEFAGLPKARGGPDRVAVEFEEQREHAPDFFKHQSHHAPNRRVIEED
jgi:hypothetical protein